MHEWPNDWMILAENRSMTTETSRRGRTRDDVRQVAHDLLSPAGVLWYVAALLCWRVVTPTWVEWNSRPIIAAVMLATVLYLASFFSPADFRTGTVVHVVVCFLARFGARLVRFHGISSLLNALCRWQHRQPNQHRLVYPFRASATAPNPTPSQHCFTHVDHAPPTHDGSAHQPDHGVGVGLLRTQEYFPMFLVGVAMRHHTSYRDILLQMTTKPPVKLWARGMLVGFVVLAYFAAHWGLCEGYFGLTRWEGCEQGRYHEHTFAANLLGRVPSYGTSAVLVFCLMAAMPDHDSILRAAGAWGCVCVTSCVCCLGRVCVSVSVVLHITTSKRTGSPQRAKFSCDRLVLHGDLISAFVDSPAPPTSAGAYTLGPYMLAPLSSLLMVKHTLSAAARRATDFLRLFVCAICFRSRHGKKRTPHLRATPVYKVAARLTQYDESEAIEHWEPTRARAGGKCLTVRALDR
jgi:hypothetical protein